VLGGSNISDSMTTDSKSLVLPLLNVCSLFPNDDEDVFKDQNREIYKDGRQIAIVLPSFDRLYARYDRQNQTNKGNWPHTYKKRRQHWPTYEQHTACK
jgi:hypothetical protein